MHVAGRHCHRLLAYVYVATGRSTVSGVGVGRLSGERVNWRECMLRHPAAIYIVNRKYLSHVLYLYCTYMRHVHILLYTHDHKSACETTRQHTSKTHPSPTSMQIMNSVIYMYARENAQSNRYIWYCTVVWLLC